MRRLVQQHPAALSLPRRFPAAGGVVVLGTEPVRDDPVHADDLADVSDKFRQSLREKQRYNFSHRIVTLQKNIKWVQAAGYHEYEGNTPQNTFGIVLDITDRILTQQRLESSAERLNHSERMESIGQLAGGVAHDFNNMLAGIIGYAELLEGEANPARIRSYVENIIEAADKASALTSQLLAFARKEKLTLKAVSLHSAANAAIGLLKRTIDKKIVIKTEFEAVSDVISGDSASLTNAILNLAINSRDAMPNGGVLSIETVTTQLTEAVIASRALQLSPGEYIELKVTDTGSGISTANLRKIFEPFFTTKPVGRGTGLGLSAVYGTIRSHGGDILVDSEEQRGTCVTIYLPLHHSDDAHSPYSKPNKQHQSLNLLIVDDESLVRNMSRDLLESAGHSVTVANDGQMGLELFNQLSDTLDGVILDLVMPKLNGHELLDCIRNSHPQLPVLIVSGYSGKHPKPDFRNDSATAALQKPFRKHQLLEAVDSLMQTTEDSRHYID